eukprot:6171905-Pleurochrysis_carterae.AAC.1
MLHARNIHRRCSAAVYLLATPMWTCSTTSEGQRPSMQSLKACGSKAHCAASQNLAIESGCGYSVPTASKSQASSACKPAMTETGKEASAAS